MSAERLTFMPLAYQDRRPTCVPPKPYATEQLVLETRIAMEECGDDYKAMAQWVAERIEEFGASMAEPVFDMNGNGPVCSWCSAIWPLCGHAERSEVLLDNDAASEQS